MAVLLGAEGYKVLEKYKVPVADYSEIADRVQLANVSEKLGFPLVMKAISQRILHKTEAGAIKIVQNKVEAIRAFSKLQKLGYVLVQKYIEGQPVIIGAKHDATFGKVVLFGSGGIMVELLKDISFRVCPITKKDADSMIREVKAYKLLKGFRGRKSVNLPALQSVLLKVCKLAKEEDIKELDLNPVIANQRGAKAVDVRIVL